MGILDDITSAINRGADAAGRTTRQTQLKMRSDQLLRQRQSLAAQLGASLYDTVRQMPELVEGRETLFNAIADIDLRRAHIQDEIDELAAVAQANAEAARTLKCTSCGSLVGARDSFCSGCGKPVSEIRDELQEYGQDADTGEEGLLACPHCGVRVDADSVYCYACGKPVDGSDPGDGGRDGATDPSEGERAEEAVQPEEGMREGSEDTGSQDGAPDEPDDPDEPVYEPVEDAEDFMPPEPRQESIF